MTKFFISIAVLAIATTITTSAVAEEKADMVCKKTTTFEDVNGVTVITTRFVCESK